MRLTPSRRASSRSGGSRRPARSSREAMRAASCSSICTALGPGAGRATDRRGRCARALVQTNRPATPAGDVASRVACIQRPDPDTFPRMTLDELAAHVADGDDRHRPAAPSTDMQGRLQGKRLTAHALPRRGARARRRGVQLPARRRRRDEHRRRLRDVAPGSAATATSRWCPDLDTLRRIPVAPGHRAVPGRRAVARRHAGRRLAAPDPAPPARPARRARLDGARRAPSSSSSSSATPTRRRGSKGYRDLDPANLYNVDYSLLGTARVEPLIRRIRNEMTGAGLSVENSKGECNFGQHEINFRYGPALADRRRARDLQERRQGDRRPGGHGDHVHGQVRRARGQLVPHPSLAARRGRRRRCSPTSPSLRRASSPASSPALRELTLLLRAERQLLQALRRRARSRRRRSPGATTTARARCASSATAPRSGWSCRLPGADVNPYLALAAMIAAGLHGDRRGARARAAGRGQRLRVRQAARAAHAARRARPVRRQRRSRARRSARRSSSTTSTTPASSSTAFDAAVTDWERVRGFERL